MKNLLYVAVTVLAIVAAVIGVIWFFRTLNNVAVSVTVREVEQGIHCATAVTSQDVAIACYEYPSRAAR